MHVLVLEQALKDFPALVDYFEEVVERRVRADQQRLMKRSASHKDVSMKCVCSDVVPVGLIVFADLENQQRWR